MRSFLKFALATLLAVCCALPAHAQYSGSAGTVTLSANYYTGNTTISAGTLDLAVGHLSLGASGTIQAGIGNGFGTLTVAAPNYQGLGSQNNTVLVNGGFTGTATASQNLSLFGSVTNAIISPSGTLVLNTVPNISLVGNATLIPKITSGTNLVIAGGALQLNSHPITVSGSVANLNALGGLTFHPTFSPMGPFPLNSPLSVVSHTLTTNITPVAFSPIANLIKNGTGTLQLTGITTNVGTPGSLTLIGTNSFSAGVSAGTQLSLASGGTLKLVVPATLNFSVVPEPSTIALATCGFAALGAASARRRIARRNSIDR